MVKKKPEEGRTFKTWENLLYPFIVVGAICLLLTFLFWNFEWLTVRLWIFISIVWGVMCEIDDSFKLKRNKKINKFAKRGKQE